ncbi:hypothetical protein B0T25DRAFT_571457 [Lasiosphaeria hispida]|uniref:Uncharacterized protein n=1 Tax=Lasiosphaeria hispida TaxID=260671 RepID=A0AAJ0HB20_9PEZI|nr:hypothetical protein B0T25DRAFT_571457 [Lasiosphaeria hispida]
MNGSLWNLSPALVGADSELRAQLFNQFRNSVPDCQCCTFNQYYSCGCLDGRLDESGKPIPTFYHCTVHYQPIVQQLVYQALGFRHYEPAQAPHSDINRILPFMCYKHHESSKIYISSQQVKRLRAEAQQVREKQARETRQSKRQQLEVVSEDRAKRMKVMREARQLTRSMDDDFAKMWNAKLYSGLGDEDSSDPWQEEQQVEVDDAPMSNVFWPKPLRVEPRPNDPTFPHFDQMRNTGYDGGAYMIDETAITRARYLNWGYNQDWIKNSTSNPCLLVM